MRRKVKSASAAVQQSDGTRPPERTLVPLPSAEPDSRLLLALVILGALVPRVAVFAVNENLYGDAVVRTELAEKWSKDPHWISSFGDGAFQFGPLHLYVVGTLLKVWPNREDA